MSKITVSSLFFLVLIRFSLYGLDQSVKFQLAYSPIVTSNQKTKICFNDSMSLVLKVKAASNLDCIRRCMQATNNNLRGINFRKPEKTCTCVPKVNIIYTVTAILTAGCQAFVTHDCPPKFEYVVENHRCYYLQPNTNTWNNSRTLCNNLLNSHPVVINDTVEMTAIQSYLNTKNFSFAWSAMYRTNISGISELLWGPYPGQNYPVSISYLCSYCPRTFSDGYCMEFFSGYYGLYDFPCLDSDNVLCEIDIKW
ncbi:hypothetical protein HELRODRAFT_183219 [Helobdella robusta]|uniref:C-type lectin domain-containing protein n=1 Tax=Helobdella robusta TaxID=6412 RepID=T1FJC0_HELRO|nr:hypothetical protein HELRODRAFT_183219 [Helobdella robusta]ESO11433.1 hypothetical protein HELRODRAFT_183219 [Helobdella robusta]